MYCRNYGEIPKLFRSLWVLLDLIMPGRVAILEHQPRLLLGWEGAWARGHLVESKSGKGLADVTMVSAPWSNPSARFVVQTGGHLLTGVRPPRPD